LTKISNNFEDDSQQYLVLNNEQVQIEIFLDNFDIKQNY